MFEASKNLSLLLLYQETSNLDNWTVSDERYKELKLGSFMRFNEMC